MKWQERLNEHEERPRPEVWASLKDRMEVQNSDLAGKVLDLELTPPAGAWSEIRKRLSEEENKTQTNQPGIIRRIGRRYIPAAAMVASVVLLTTIYVRESQKRPDQSAKLAASIHVPISDMQKTEPAPTEPVVPAEAPKNKTANSPPIALQSPKYASVRKTNRNYISNGGRLHDHHEKKQLLIERGINYIQICGNSTQCDRLTYKLEEFAPCIHEAADRRHASKPATEKERRIDDWRRKLQQSDYVPAAGHFLDILEMASMLSRESK